MAGNSLLTINMITREAVRLFKNTNAFMQNINRQYDDSFAVQGAKIGQSLRIRYPNDYTVNSGPAISIQDTAEQSTTLTVAFQNNVAVSFNTVEQTMSLDDYSERVLAPQINNLAGYVAAQMMQGVETGVCNFTSNFDASGNVITPTLQQYLNAKAILANNSAPTGDRKIVNSPQTDARVVQSLTGLLNPGATISEQYRNGEMINAVGFDWMEDQTVIAHTSGSFTAGTVNGAGQSGQTITVNGITGSLNAGDFITIAGVFAVNRVTKQTTGSLRQFVVTAPAISGATSISIFPAITPAIGGQQVQYQTVTASPANAAAITLLTLPNVTYLKNIAFAPEAITMVTADLVEPKNVEVARDVFDGVSMRMIRQYNSLTDQDIQRLDILWGFLFIRPEWCVCVADVT